MGSGYDSVDAGETSLAMTAGRERMKSGLMPLTGLTWSRSLIKRHWIT